MKQLSNYGDPIEALPVDKTLPDHSEIEIVNSLFTNKKTVYRSIRDPMLVIFIFIFLNLFFVDSWVRKLAPNFAKSDIAIILIKAIIAGFVLWIYQNIITGKE